MRNPISVCLAGVFVIVTMLQTKEAAGQDIPWTFPAANPIISVAADRHLWNDPTVVKSGSTYVMFLTRNTIAPGIGPVLPYRAVSSDGIHWVFGTKPLLAAGAASDFDGSGVETPSVVVLNGTYHMYYMGYNQATGGAGGTVHIGHATSADGITWIKDERSPVLSPTFKLSDWNGYQVAEPGAVVFNNRIYLYYTAVSVDTSVNPPVVTRTIGLSLSDDGFSFGEQKRVVTVGPAYPRSMNYEGYSCLAAAVVEGQIHLFYDVFQYLPGVTPSDRIQVALHHAVSPDGVSSFVEDPAPFFVRGESKWNAREIRSPFVMQDGGVLKLWYAGDDLFRGGASADLTAPWGIGYAEAPLGIAATPPPAPSLWFSGAAKTSLTLSWNPPADAGAGGYRVELSSSSDFSSFVTVYNSWISSSATTVTVPFLSPGKSYYARIRKSAGNQLVASGGEIVAGRTLDPVAVPADLRFSGIAATSMQLSWAPVSGAAGYQVDFSSQPGFLPHLTFDAGNATTMALRWLAPGTTYYVRIRAYDAARVLSANSQTASAATLAR